MRPVTLPFRIAVATALLITPLFVTPIGAQPPARGRGGAPQPPPQNLQVLPSDTSRADVLVVMRGFTQGLGVQCGYCHAEGQGGRNDFASDDKPAKKTARLMMQMVTRVNETIASGVGKPEPELTKVQCATCHRGEAIPKVPPPVPPAERARP